MNPGTIHLDGPWTIRCEFRRPQSGYTAPEATTYRAPATSWGPFDAIRPAIEPLGIGLEGALIASMLF
jgi:hypothetical protein